MRHRHHCPVITGVVLLVVLAAGAAVWTDPRDPTCPPSTTVVDAAVCVTDTTLDVRPDVDLTLP